MVGLLSLAWGLWAYHRSTHAFADRSRPEPDPVMPPRAPPRAARHVEAAGVEQAGSVRRSTSVTSVKRSVAKRLRRAQGRAFFRRQKAPTMTPTSTVTTRAQPPLTTEQVDHRTPPGGGAGDPSRAGDGDDRRAAAPDDEGAGPAAPRGARRRSLDGRAPVEQDRRPALEALAHEANRLAPDADAFKRQATLVADALTVS